MRTTLAMVLAAFAFACGTPSGNDGGTGGGTGGSGGGSGGGGGGSSGPVCLPDREDAGVDDGGTGTNFSCRGAARPLGGQAALIITGKATRAGLTRLGLPAVQLDLLSTTGTVLATTVSDDAGVYTLRVDAGCEPLAGEVRAQHTDPDAGFYLSYAVPESPWQYDRGNLELVMFDGFARQLVGGFAGVTIQNGTAVLALTVEDCEGKPVLDALVNTADDAGTVRYVGTGGVPQAGNTATSSNGQVVIFNLPGTSTEVIATLDGGVIGRRVVPIHADAATGTFLRP
jgi:hypothetical protein